MNVVSHRLLVDGQPLDVRSSPNANDGLLERLAIVMHFTAGRGFAQSCDWLCSPKSRASAHLVIGRGGEVAQLVPFNRRAWHAGSSQWAFGNGTAVSGLNSYSLGIELDNFGHLQHRASGWHTYWGQRVPDDDVVVALDGTGWHAYSEAQLDRAFEVCEALVDAYPAIRELLGHSDIAPRRKVDPGPAFPMISFRARLFGRENGEA